MGSKPTSYQSAGRGVDYLTVGRCCLLVDSCGRPTLRTRSQSRQLVTSGAETSAASMPCRKEHFSLVKPVTASNELSNNSQNSRPVCRSDPAPLPAPCIRHGDVALSTRACISSACCASLPWNIWLVSLYFCCRLLASFRECCCARVIAAGFDAPSYLYIGECWFYSNNNSVACMTLKFTLAAAKLLPVKWKLYFQLMCEWTRVFLILGTKWCCADMKQLIFCTCVWILNTCICNVPCDADVDDDVLRWLCSVNLSHYRQKSQPESSFVSIAPLYLLNPTEYKHLSGNYRWIVRNAPSHM